MDAREDRSGHELVKYALVDCELHRWVFTNRQAQYGRQNGRRLQRLNAEHALLVRTVVMVAEPEGSSFLHL